ncbi:MAG: hypothetical protein RJB60_1749 [Pseudomonadota bacterium]
MAHADKALDVDVLNCDETHSCHKLAVWQTRLDVLLDE